MCTDVFIFLTPMWFECEEFVIVTRENLENNK